jgi:diguanylate cyclase (GGDEF)-like protein
MLWYIAVIAGLNLALGYLWAAHLRPCPRCAKIRELNAVLGGSNTSSPLDTATRPSLQSARADRPNAPGLEMPSRTSIADAAERDSALMEASTMPDSRGVRPTEVMVAPSRSTNHLDPATGLATREQAETVLSELSSRDTTKEPVTVALVEVDEIDWLGQQATESIDERVLMGVSVIVRESLSSQHTAARFGGQQLLLVVPHEDVHQATRRAEELRQRVATTSFIADGRTLQTTVTCALAEVTQERSRDELLEFLHEALGEAKRYGGNRTFMHDGKSPTPVVPPELEVAPQQVAI